MIKQDAQNVRYQKIKIFNIVTSQNGKSNDFDSDEHLFCFLIQTF